MRCLGVVVVCAKKSGYAGFFHFRFGGSIVEQQKMMMVGLKGKCVISSVKPTVHFKRRSSIESLDAIHEKKILSKWHLFLTK
ncbi:hypothetical protein L195_g013139 [Trifolium pratense]|uniref:Uncharacterized protein n=1 Tax=Trifolium pratense TaxID=57577 RepID=A0A2K3PMB1_TRIPR|nr:hypothetical protein L195_g013139 [Trifolium pratense]